MTTEVETETAVAERIYQLCQHLGIKQAHVAARGSDWPELAAAHPELFASLTLVLPGIPSPDTMSHLDDNLLVYTGAEGDYLTRVQDAVDSVRGGTLVSLHNFAAWSDVVADNLAQMAETMLPFWARTHRPDCEAITDRDGESGEVAGISYMIEGSGPPLLMFPIGLIPSQWEPLLPQLREQYCVITLGGDQLGMVALLEARGKMAGYLGMVRNVMAAAQLEAGESVLEVGCGTGVLSRWLANYTGGESEITAVDINNYLLREAAILAKLAGLGDAITFQKGNAEALPFPDNSFDVTMSSTVMEEVDADQMLAEMVRVTKPGGRVAVIVRALDVPFFINLPLSAELKAKVEDPTAWAPGVGEKGCADASLYRRFQQSALNDIKMLTYLTSFDAPAALMFLHHGVQSILTPDEAQAWQTAKKQAEAEGTFFYSYPHHCAVGTKPV